MGLGLAASPLRHGLRISPLFLLLAACGVETGAIHDTPPDEAANGTDAASRAGDDDSTANADAGTTSATTGATAPGATSDGGGATTTASTAIDGGALLPHVVSSGGNVLASPRFVALTFDGYAYRASVESFVSNIGLSDFWKQTTSEYGIGAGAAGPVVHLGGAAGSPCSAFTSAACIDDAAIKRLLLQQFSAGAAKYDPNTVYTVVFPANVTLTRNGATSCTDFAGYHDQVALTDGTNAIYAVIPTCSSAAAAGLSPLNIVTAEIGHQLIDAASDPLPATSPAYLAPPDNQLGWVLGASSTNALAGGELSDLCAAESASFVTDPALVDPTQAGAPQYVQRSWSNAAAALGQDPCVPHVADPYFNAIAVVGDQASLSYSRANGTRSTASIHVASLGASSAGSSGSSKTLPVQLIGDPAAGPFTVRAVDFAGVTDSYTGARTPSSYFTFAWDNGKDAISGTAGQVVHLTITATAQATALASTVATAVGSVSAVGAKDFPFLPVWIGSTATDASGKSVEHLSFFLTDLAAPGSAP